MYLNGETIEQIAQDKSISEEEVIEYLKEYRLLTMITTSVCVLGSKQEQYYENEDDMLIKLHYNYEDLSPSEKKIYESRSDK